MSFDAAQFLEQPINESNSVDYIPVPVGDYLAIVEKVDIHQWTKKDDPSITGLALDVFWSIDDQKVKETLGRDKVVVKQGIMLDMTDSGSIDFGKGKNVNLGRLREAVGLNQPGVPFSFPMLAGRLAKVKVKHDIYKGAPMAQVESVAKA